MRPLDEHARHRLLTFAAILCAIPLCLAPLAAESSFELAGERTILDTRSTSPALAAVWGGKPVSVERDPFLSERPHSDTGGPAAAIVGMHVIQGDPTGFVLPANAGAAAAPPSPVLGAGMRVSAVVSGASPRALVDDGDRVRVVGIGDLVAGIKIVQIDRIGVHLANGSVMGVAEDVP